MKNAMNRRTFLLSGSAGVAALAIDFPSLAQALGSPGVVLSIGYLEGSELLGKAARRAQGGAALSSALIPATQLPGADIALIERGARVTVEGRVGTSTGRYRSLALQARFRGDAALEADIPYYAWEERGANTSSPVSFVMQPVEPRGLEFTIEVEPSEPVRRRTALRGAPAPAVAAESRQIPFALSMGWDGAPFLRPGIYFLAVAGAALDWRRFEYVRKEGDRARMLYETGGLALPARFDCIAISIDYDRGPEPEA